MYRLQALHDTWDDALLDRTRIQTERLFYVEQLAKQQNEQLEHFRIKMLDIEKQNELLIDWQKKAMNEAYEK